MKEIINFDMESASQALREGKDLSGKDGKFTPPEQTEPVNDFV